ncbi:hypothetical protein Sjap_005923 [Stephania japonica]|uniref:RING-type domain-containing protein n=1 Tax=Stephania japonica TaxID=461633 RepID=A0AAP0PLJ9_9MAGN
MSSCRVSQPLRSYVRDARRRKPVLNFDLNVPLSDNVGDGGGSSNVVDAGLGEVRSNDRVGGGESLKRAGAIDVEAFDDEVLISSPRRFVEARERARRNHGANVVLVEGSGTHQELSEARLTRVTINRYKKRKRLMPNQGSAGSERCINLEGGECSKGKNIEKPSPAPPPPPPPPLKELTLSCPVCMNPFEEEMSTKCGHIFCKKCINTAVMRQNKCPTCRRKLAMKDMIRIYLPSAT